MLAYTGIHWQFSISYRYIIDKLLIGYVYVKLVMNMACIHKELIITLIVQRIPPYTNISHKLGIHSLKRQGVTVPQTSLVIQIKN